MREELGAKGSAEIYICGALLGIAIPKYRTNADASFTNPNKSFTGTVCEPTQNYFGGGALMKYVHHAG